MTAIRQAPWSLRSYAALTLAIGILAAYATGRGQSWANVLGAAALGIAACTGNRAIWWLLVAWNACILCLFPVFFGATWRVSPFGFIGLALLLAPASRRYVFARDPEPSPASDG